MTTSKKSATTTKTSAITPEDILAGLTPDVADLVQDLRRLILDTVPDAVEIAYPVWKGIGYHHGTSGYFCAIFPQPSGVKLGFEFGVLLPDPDRVLEGAGKQVRYVVIQDAARGAAQIPAGAIKRLLAAALSLPEGKEAKLSMVRAGAKLIQAPDRMPES